MANRIFELIRDGRIDPALLNAAGGGDAAVKTVPVFGRNSDIDSGAEEDVHDAGGSYPYPTAARVHAIVSDNADDGDDANAATGSIVIADYTEFAAVAATGSITYGAPDNGDTVIVDGNTFTKVAAAPGAGEFSTIAELEALVEAVAGVNSSEDGTTVSITAATPGAAGNSITLALGGGNTGTMSVSGATLTGGEDVVTITVNGVAFVAGVDFTAATSNNDTATSLRAAINASVDVAIDGVLTAGGSNATVSITADTAGAAGNSITLATSETDAATVSGANLTGGDDANNVGALSVRVTGVDADYEEITEDVTMGGTVAVNTVNSYLRINSMEVLTAGSYGTNKGNITATAATDNTVTAKILADNGKALQAVFTVPAGFSGFVMGMHATQLNEASGSAILKLLARTNAGPWILAEAMGGNPQGEGSRKFLIPRKFAEKTDLRLRALTADNTDLGAGFDLLLVKDVEAVV